MQTFYTKTVPGQRTSFTIPQSDTIYAVVLEAGVEQQITVPDGANIVSFAPTGDFYCRFDAAETISEPETSITDGSASELNPGMRDCSEVSKIHLVAPQACTVTLSFYS